MVGNGFKTRRIILAAALLLLGFVWSGPVLALDPKKAITQYMHDVWRVEQGLPSNTIAGILQTRDGYLWFGTEGGLARFDGVQLTLFNQTEATKNYGVRALYEDRAGNLWIGTTGGGLVKYKDGQFITYTTKDGLAEDRVQAIYEDREGNLWIGTQSGVSRFSAGDFTTLPVWGSTVVGAITEDRAGTLWIGGGGGLGQMEEGKFTLFTAKDGLSDNGVNPVYEDREGNLWIGTNRGLNRWEDGRFVRYTAKDGFPEVRVMAIYEDREGNLWIGTFGSGLGRLKDGKFTSFTSKDGLTDDRAVSIHEDREGSLWVGTYGGGVNRFKDGKVTPYTTSEGLSENWAYAVYQDRAGDLWIGTKNGLTRIKDGHATTYTTGDGLSHNAVRSIYEDRDGNLWIGTQGGGLNHFKDGRFTSYTIKDTYNDVRCIYQDRQGRLWVGGLIGSTGLIQFSEGRLVEYPMTDRIPGLVRSILEDRREYLWIGTNRGLVRMNDNEFTHYTTREGLSSLDAMSLYEDREGVLWIGTYGGGLNHFKDGRFTSYTIKDTYNDVRCIYQDRQGRLWVGGLIGSTGLIQFSEGRLVEYPMTDRIPGLVRSILEDRREYLWIGTNRGLVRMNDNEFTHYTTREGLSSLDAMSLYEDREGVLWIGTYGGGLNRFKDGKFTSITMGHGLFDKVVYRILEDDRDNFWMSGNKGIFRVSKKELNDVAEGKIKTISCVAYGLADGMRSLECAGAHQPAGWKTRDGRLWFPTTKGVVMIDPENIPTNPVPPPVHIEQVRVDQTLLDPRQRAEIPPSKGDFEFHYTALSFVDPSKVKFKYLLEGYDQVWIDAGTRRVAYYTHLPPGQYRFRVIACNNDGVWNETGAALEFSLKPHFYQTKWFYALCALAAVLLGVGIYQLRVRQLKAREQKLNQLVRERTLELVEVARQLVDMNETLDRRVQEGVKALAEAERMAAYGQTVAGVVHEVRQPVFGLRTAAYLLQENFDNPEYAQAQLKTIEREANRLADVTRDLLEFVRPTPLVPTPTDPAKLLEEVVETYYAESGSRFPAIALELPPDPPTIMVDRSRLVQVLLNLIQNAAKHAQGLTTVTLSVGIVTGLPAGEEPSQLCIRVKDDGAGIPPERLPRIFEPFFTSGNGTGLGLTIVQRIVKEHGGTIGVESEPGQGTMFTICLPIETTDSTDYHREKQSV